MSSHPIDPLRNTTRCDQDHHQGLGSQPIRMDARTNASSIVYSFSDIFAVSMRKAKIDGIDSTNPYSTSSTGNGNCDRSSYSYSNSNSSMHKSRNSNSYNYSNGYDFNLKSYFMNKLVSYNSNSSSNNSNINSNNNSDSNNNSLGKNNNSDSSKSNSDGDNKVEKANVANDDLEWEEWDGRGSFIAHMIAGSCAGLAEHVSIFPIDTLKTHVQCERCGSTSPFESWTCAARIVEREGVFRLWRGVGAMFFGTIPAHAAYFSIFENMKWITGADQPGHHPVAASLCGAAAATVHDLFMTPCDVVKQRMQLGYYKNLSDCFRTIVKQEGWRSLYASLPTTLSMNIPYGMVMVAINETLRKVINPSGEYSISTSMISGGVAGAVAAAVTNPLDVIKTRLQTQNLEPCLNMKFSTMVVHTPSLKKSQIKSGVSGAIEVFKLVLTTEGVSGFGRGIFPRMLTQVPAVAISWSTYEFVKNTLTTNFKL